MFNNVRAKAFFASFNCKGKHYYCNFKIFLDTLRKYVFIKSIC